LEAETSEFFLIPPVLLSKIEDLSFLDFTDLF
jgi:hypothetical protein